MTSSAGFDRVVILGGGGVMGHGIALACLQGGDCHVTIVSRRPESVAHGLSLIVDGSFGLNKAVQRGKLTAERAEQLRQQVSGTTDYAEGLSGADLVIESVPEIVDTKIEALRMAERLAPPSAVFTTNTSAIMITELAARMERPERLVGTHWFFPGNVMPLVEVAHSEIGSPDALASVVAFLQAIGKKPVVVKDSPGFFMTRFINLFIAEAMRLVELGVVGPAEVDEMVKAGLGWPMGVFELLDKTANFDAWYHAQEYLHNRLGERYAIPPLAHRVFLAGYLGSPQLKPGSRGGWYEYLGAEHPKAPPK